MSEQEPMHERTHLSERPDDWATANDQEWADALGTGKRPVDPRFINYAERNRPEAICRYLKIHEQMGGLVGPPARRFLRRHGR